MTVRATSKIAFLESGVLGDEASQELRRLLVQAVNSVCPAWLANDREDIVQTALLRLMEKGRTRDDTIEFPKAYARRVAYTQVIDEIRRRRRRRETALEDYEKPGGFFQSSQPDPEADSEGLELGEAIRECLGRLAPPRKTAITLWLLGHENREIARLMGWKSRRAENLVTRGRNDLRSCLVKKGYRE